MFRFEAKQKVSLQGESLVSYRSEIKVLLQMKLIYIFFGSKFFSVFDDKMLFKLIMNRLNRLTNMLFISFYQACNVSFVSK